MTVILAPPTLAPVRLRPVGLWPVGIPRPFYDWYFEHDRDLVGLGYALSFGRASIALPENAVGGLSVVASGDPVFPYEDGIPLGLRGQGARTNSLIYSQDGSNAAWTKSQVTHTTDGTLAPNVSELAQRAEETAVTSEHRLFQNTTIAAGAIAGSAFLKADERTEAEIFIFNSTDSVVALARIDLSDGTVSNVSGVNASAYSIGLANGWWRLVVTGTNSHTTAGNGLFVRMVKAGSFNYAGTVGEGLYWWGAQLETGSFASDYIPSDASAATQPADATSIAMPFDVDSGWVACIFKTPFQSGSAPRIWELYRDSNNYTRLIGNGSGNIIAEVVEGGVDRLSQVNDTYSTDTRLVSVLSWGSGTHFHQITGGALRSATSANTPAVQSGDTLRLMAGATANTEPFSTMERFMFQPNATLTSDQVSALVASL